MLELQRHATLKLSGYPTRIGLIATQIELVVGITGWKDPATLKRDGYGEPLDEAQERSNTEVLRCLDLLSRSATDLNADVQSVPIWVARINDAEVDEALSRLVVALQEVISVSFHPMMDDKIKGALQLNKECVPRMDGAITTLTLRSLNLLGHRETVIGESTADVPKDADF